jgi:SRSO17 transposase
MTHEQIDSLERELAVFLTLFRPCFLQDRTFAHLRQYLLGLLSDVPRKSVEPIALTAGTPVRTLQAFLSKFQWDHDRADAMLQRLVAQEHACTGAIGVIDATSHAKRGDKTPGVQRQWCGETGKNDNCVVAQCLLYTNNHSGNPFSCMLDCELFLPESWSADRERCRAAGIPDDVVHRCKWEMAIGQLQKAIGNGVRLQWVTFDEDYGNVPDFWFGLDRLGLWGVGEVRSNFNAWATEPAYNSQWAAHAPKRVDNLTAHSPVFTRQEWKEVSVKSTTRGIMKLHVKAALVQLVAEPSESRHHCSRPTDRRYWLIVTHNRATDEKRYLVSNAPANTPVEKLLEVAFARWHVEKWFERAKQEAGLGAFEVRTYTSLIRHWLICRIAMLFLARQTARLREKKSTHHLRAGRAGSQRRGVESLAAFSTRAAGTRPPVLVSSAA